MIKPSVIDYALCSEPLIKEVISFIVLPFTGLSDHCCISLKIKTNVEIEIVPPIKNKIVVVNAEGINKHKYTSSEWNFH